MEVKCEAREGHEFHDFLVFACVGLGVFNGVGISDDTVKQFGGNKSLISFQLLFK